MNYKEIAKQLEEIEQSLTEQSAVVFNIVTEAIMKEFPEATVVPQDIIDGLEAVIKVTRLHSDTDAPKGH